MTKNCSRICNSQLRVLATPKQFVPGDQVCAYCDIIHKQNKNIEIRTAGTVM